MKTLSDIYKCPHCGSIAAHGDNHCRGCGVKFSNDDIETMQNNIQSVVGALPWNTRDIYKCVHCEKHICIKDSYCRNCGDEIEDHEKQLMHLNLKEIAQDNTKPLIGLGIVVLLVIFVCVLIAKGI